MVGTRRATERILANVLGFEAWGCDVGECLGFERLGRSWMVGPMVGTRRVTERILANVSGFGG